MESTYGTTGTTPGTRADTERATGIKDSAARSARALAGGAQRRTASQLDRGKQRAAATLGSVASSLLNSGSQLRDDAEEIAGEYVERAARGVERAARYVEDADLRQMIDDVEALGRKRPAVFVGTAFAIGLVLGRLMRSSREVESNTRGNDAWRTAASGVAEDYDGPNVMPRHWEQDQ